MGMNVQTHINTMISTEEMSFWYSDNYDLQWIIWQRKLKLPTTWNSTWTLSQQIQVLDDIFTSFNCSEAFFCGHLIQERHVFAPSAHLPGLQTCSKLQPDFFLSLRSNESYCHPCWLTSWHRFYTRENASDLRLQVNTSRDPRCLSWLGRADTLNYFKAPWSAVLCSPWRWKRCRQSCPYGPPPPPGHMWVNEISLACCCGSWTE